MNIESNVICRQPGRYLGWPTVAKAPGGTIYVVFCGDRDAHVCPFGKFFLIRSQDEGLTWSEPKLIVDTPLDERDAGMCICPDGTIVVSFWTSHYADYRPLYEKFYASRYPSEKNRWAAWEEKISQVTPDVLRHWAPSYQTPDQPECRKRWLGFWTVRSRDGGVTWDEPALSPVYCPHGPNTLPNGDLLFVGMKAITRWDGEKNIGVARSADKGRTWEMLAYIPSFPPYRGKVKDGFSRIAEPHVVMAPSGKLIAMTRYEETRDPDHPYFSRLWQFESMDGGHTWSEPHDTPIIGKPPHLSVLKNGNILVTYGYRNSPFGQRACISNDEGKTWQYDREIILRDDAPNADLGYASSVECHEGDILSVYYQVERKGERPSIMMSRIPAGYESAMKPQSMDSERGSPVDDPFTL